MSYLILNTCKADKAGPWSNIHSANAIKQIPNTEHPVEEETYIPPKGVQ